MKPILFFSGGSTFFCHEKNCLLCPVLLSWAFCRSVSLPNMSSAHYKENFENRGKFCYTEILFPSCNILQNSLSPNKGSFLLDPKCFVFLVPLAGILHIKMGPQDETCGSKKGLFAMLHS